MYKLIKYINNWHIKRQINKIDLLKTNICPICDSHLKENVKDSTIPDLFKLYIHYCDNGCFKREMYNTATDRVDFYIFNEHFHCWTLVDDKFSDVQRKIRKYIYYWKENDRYLIKLIEEK